tara:strand:+ start:6582 stop:6842 length:261 start_codon:yes stop_codon:yes gene_type:complete
MNEEQINFLELVDTVARGAIDHGETGTGAQQLQGRGFVVAALVSVLVTLGQRWRMPLPDLLAQVEFYWGAAKLVDDMAEETEAMEN